MSCRKADATRYDLIDCTKFSRHAYDVCVTSNADFQIAKFTIYFFAKFSSYGNFRSDAQLTTKCYSILTVY
eukprot:SAG31_NODE_380_length_16468_cov_8.328548_5_plen_71_part_00